MVDDRIIGLIGKFWLVLSQSPERMAKVVIDTRESRSTFRNSGTAAQFVEGGTIGPVPGPSGG
jgi:hypothetical protein